jgi:phosphatidylinositol 3,5-bisphosphate 5-phosphatase
MALLYALSQLNLNPHISTNNRRFGLVPPHIYISLVVLSWGLLASSQSLVTSYPQLLVLRFLLGISEAAFCGVPFYLSFFYRRSELALRTGYFIAAAPLATSFASSLAWLITWLGKVIDGELDGDVGEGWISSWRLLFLVEGFPSCLVAVAVWRLLPDGPESANFLSRQEKEVAVLRLESERQTEPLDEKHAVEASKPKIKVREILKTLRDPKCYLTAAMFFSCNVAFSSMPVFLPTIIREMGFSSVVAQALSAPPYLFSFAAVLVTSSLSDRTQIRSSYILFHSLVATSGYLFILISGLLRLPDGIRYLGIYPACIGFFSCVTLIITWTLNNQESDSGKGTGVALLQLIGQCGPLLGTRVFPKSDGPLYIKGMAICAAFMLMVGVLAYVLRVVLERENSMTRGLRGSGKDEERLMSAGSKVRKKAFMYML